MAEMIFYKQLASLNGETHKDLRIDPGSGYGFASATNSVPLVAVEFADAGREYPIAFVQASDGAFLPVALLGLRENENLYVSAEGKWDARYIPAFVRRYPFVPADGGGGEAVVCIDEAADCLNRQDGDLLFVNGKPSPRLDAMLRLLEDYQAEAGRTQEVCRRLAEYGLLVESNAQAQLPGGPEFRLNGLFVVEEKRLQDLAPEKVQALLASGELGLVYAHLMSLGNLQPLLERLGARLADRK